MSDSEKTFLLNLLQTPSPTGWEMPGQKVWTEYVRMVSDSVDSDSYGNTWATLYGKADGSAGSPKSTEGKAKHACRIMLEAHADEIGFIIRHIDEKGFITLAPIGGSDKTIAAARRIRFFGEKGEMIGIIGNTAVHLRESNHDKPLDWKDLYVDVGASSTDDVAKLGLRVGTPAVYYDNAIELPSGRITGRGLDNRIGGWLLGQILKELAAGERPNATTLAVNAIQEEIGSHGARMIAHRLQPTIAIVFDVTHATDVPGISYKEHGKVELGKGPTIAHGGANHASLVKQLLRIAEAENIPIQHEAVSRSTRTDADVVYTSRSGIPTALVSIPLRNMHSPVEIIDLVDVQHTIKLITTFIRSTQKEDV